MSEDPGTDSQPETQAPEPNTSSQATTDDSDARQWAMIAHLSALVGFIIPFGNVIGPLVVWQIKKDMPFVEEQGKEALNFQITVIIAVIACFILSFIAIGLLLLPIVGIGALVLTIIAGIKANSGEHYQYPLTIRMIK